MKKNVLIPGIFIAGLLAFYSCNHPRTEREGPRTPENREMSPHEGAPATTDTAHNDSVMEVDSTRFPDDPETPNF